MKYFNKDIFKNSLILSLFIFLIELIFRGFLKYPIFDWSVFRIFIGILFFSLIISIIFSFFKKKLAFHIINILLILISGIYAIAQAGFYNYLGVFISLSTSTQLEAVTEYVKDYFDSFNKWFYIMLLPVILYCLIFFLIIPLIKKKIEEKEKEKEREKNKKKKNNNKSKKSVNSKKTNNKKIKIEVLDDEEKKAETRLFWLQKFVAFLVVLFLGIVYSLTLNLGFMQNEYQIVSNKSLFRNPSNPNLAVSQFGVGLFGILDIKTHFFPVSDSEDGTYIVENNQNAEQEETDYTRTIDDTAWELLMADTTNTSTQNTLNEYLISRTITAENEYTGLFAGKNLIVIMMESVNNIVLNEEYFPNIYKLYSEGWSWDNSFSPRNSCSTGNNEMSGLISLFSIYRTCTANVYKDNTYANSLFNLFNEAGYYTTSYHNYTEKYYYRSTIHTNMYVSQYYGVEDLGISYSTVYKEWPSDVDLVDAAFPIFTNTESEDQPYMAWLTTVSAHQPYYSSSELSEKNASYFENTEYSEELKRYLSKLKETDLAIGELLAELEEAGTLEDTVIVLYADHYPYGLSDEDIASYLGEDIYTQNNIDKTPFIIYNSELEATSFDEYTTYMNILPTLANLFDLDYDPRYYMGSDILSDDYENIAIFADGSWESEIAYYNATTSQITYKGDETYTSEEIQQINVSITNRINMSNLAITSNYFEYLYEGLEKYKVVEDTSEDEPSEDSINEDELLE